MNRRSAPARVLVVDDEASVRAAYGNILNAGVGARPELDAMEAALFGGASAAGRTGDGVELVCASQGMEGHALVVRAVAEKRPFAVAFIDMRMPPGWDGLETAVRIRAADPDIQIVIATAYSDHAWDDVVRRVGRVESLFLLKKPFDPIEARQLVAALAEKWRLTRKAAYDLAEMNRLGARLEETVHDLEREVATRCAAQAALHQHAYYDPLTGLPNRLHVAERLEVAVSRRRRDPSHTFALLFVDLDGFKLVNDSLGHEMGDRVLAEIARRIERGVADADAVARVGAVVAARLGGDEFVVLIEDIVGASDAIRVAERLLARIAAPIDLAVQQVALSASIGIAVADGRHANAEAVLGEADTAMYRAKSECSRIAVFDPAMQAAARRRLTLESELRRAVEAEHFTIEYQPIVHAVTRQITAFEALLRWEHPDYPSRDPAEFVPVAEETGLIVRLGRWVLERAFGALAAVRADSPEAADIRVSVNVSRLQLLDPRFADDVREIAERTGVPVDRIDLEVTESAIMGDEVAALRRLAELKQVGVGVHLDDFGTGRSALSCLRNFPIDVVKIDRSFVSGLGDSAEAAAIVEAIVMLAHRLGMCVTVEGVETDRQMTMIRDLGSDFAQGYLVHRPMAIAALAELVRSQCASPSAPSAAAMLAASA